jgi:hypothetical protein
VRRRAEWGNDLAAGGIIADLAVCPETLGVGCAAALAVYLLADSEGS